MALGRQPSQRIRRTPGMLAVAAIVLVSASSCAAAGPATTAAPTSSGKAAVPSASAAPGVPADLRAVWTTTLVYGDQEIVMLTLTERSYVIRRGPNRVPGSVAGSNDGEIRFFASAICEGTGTYRWSMDAGTLRFVLVSDPCPGRSEVLEGQSYHR